MRCQHFPASLGLPRYLFLLHRGVTGIWALITAILVGGTESGRRFQKSKWLRKERGPVWGQRCRTWFQLPPRRQEGRAPRGDGKNILVEDDQALTFLNRSGEEKKELCLVSGLESHWTLLRNFSCHWWSAGAESLGYGNPVWTVASWKSDLHSIIPMG